MLEMRAWFLEKKQSVGSTSLSACHRKPPSFELGTFQLGWHQKARCESCHECLLLLLQEKKALGVHLSLASTLYGATAVTQSGVQVK